MDYYYLLIIVIVVLIIYYLFTYAKSKSKSKSNMYYYHTLDNNQLTFAIKDILKNNNINEIKEINEVNNKIIRFMNGYNNVEKELQNIPDNTYEYIAGIVGMDYIVGKNYLWSVLKQYYPQDKLITLVPDTYILTNIVDVKRLMLSSLQKNKIFIFKKNIQRQEGLLLLTCNEITHEKIDNMIKENFVIGQEYLDTPFIIGKRKCNLRVYLLLIICDGYINSYIYNDGFMYYSEKEYTYSTDREVAITTGLQKDRNVYKENPLTLKDLKIYLGIEKTDKLFNNINKLLVDIINGTSRVLKGHQGSKNFSLFGCDIQPDQDLNVKLIEINKSPSLDPKDARDSELKYNLQQDILKTIGLIENINENGFYKII